MKHSNAILKSDTAEESKAAPSGQEPSVVHTATTMTPVPLDCLPVEFPLPCPIYVLVAERYVMLRSRGDTLTVARVQSLAKAGADAVHILRANWQEFVNGVEEYHMPGELDPDERMRHMRALLMANEEQFGSHEPRKMVFLKFENLVGHLVEEIYRDPSRGVRHLRRNHDPVLYAANHAVNSAIYATLIGMSLKYPLNDGKKLAYACLVHDIGNFYIPKTVLQKKGPLTPEEFELMRTHTTRGAELLQSMGAPTEVVQTAYQHHERVDGKGYPQGLSGKNIHPYAKICAIADVYDAITSTRAHQAGLSGAEAMHRMRSQEGLFDMEFLAKLSFDKFR